MENFEKLNLKVRIQILDSDDQILLQSTIDQNQLNGGIYIQPTKTVEFIYLTFNITPTGATFPG